MEKPAGEPRGLFEPFAAYVGVLILAVLFRWLGRLSPWAQELTPALLAAAFLFGPQFAARLSGRPFDSRQLGFIVGPWSRHLKLLGVVLLVTWPLYIASFFLFFEATCPPHGPLHALQSWVSPACPFWKGIGFRFAFPDGFLQSVLAQLALIALPEEVFFRGYLYARFETYFASARPRYRVALPLLLSSFLFGLGHGVVDLNPARFAVFFPGLIFGYLRLRSGSVAPGAIFHALCNLLAEIMYESYF